MRRLLLVTTVIAASARLAGAQALPNCDYIFENTPATTANLVEQPSGQSLMILGRGVVVSCAGQNNRIASDSAQYNEDTGVLFLIGNVRYTEPQIGITAERMTYFRGEDRLNAEGNVVATMSSGSVMRAPAADYYRAVVGRPIARTVATGRPQLSLVEPGPGGAAAEPVVVLADQIVLVGDSLVYASRRVDITRGAVRANGDSAFVDSEAEFVRLMLSPVVNGRGEQQFTLRGGVIDLFSRERKLERVLATPSGHVFSGDLELLADSIDMRLANDQLREAYAWGPGRARATSPERDITADSIYVLTPNQRLREMHAVGNAFANSIPDTATVAANERDWISGDTIVARFDSVAAGDTARVAPRELVATGDARSFYQFGNPEGVRERPTMNYVRGRIIAIAFADGEVSTVTVTEQASGVYLEAESLTAIPPPAAGSATTQPPPRPAPSRPVNPR
ncbi:MAG: LptA/OstA family protein [Gemmatimonadaceae bacterium]